MPKKRKGRSHNKSKEKSKGLWSWFNEKILWLSAIGLLGVGSSWVYAYFMNDINLRYSKKIGSGYEFNIENSSSTDREIERFRVELNSTQGIIAKFNRDIYVNVKNGKVDLPGGNVSYIPATEFEELDGMVLSSGSSMNFRIPPLLSQSFISPDYLLVDVVYKTRPTNSVLALFEKVMAISGLWNSEYKLRYLVADNYWTPVSTNKHIDVLEQACRENHNLRPRPICS